MRIISKVAAIKAVMAAGGALAIGYYIAWWAQDGRWQAPVYVAVLLAALAYILLQMVASWVLDLLARTPPEPKPAPGGPGPGGPSVDVLVAAYKEPVALVRAALAAALAMRGNKTVWLLDDGDDRRLEELAQALGCGYLTRRGQDDAKAGNLNAALPRTQGEILAIFDIDHHPRPDYLERTLGKFADPAVGFVQVMVTFRNFDESWVAHAATESSLEFYNPTYLGADRLGAATLMGSNALIRRTALASIGGYQPGLAEDLATSVALHAAGWKSAYVAEPLAPGLSPSSLSAWSQQQLKWARGVFEVFLTCWPQLWRMTWGQRISYTARMTKYWIGPAVAVHLAATILVLFAGSFAQRAAFHDYLLHLAPLVVMDMVIRGYTLRLHRPPATPKSSLVGAVMLVYASWPVYLVAWVLALLRQPVRFRPTPKGDTERLDFVWLLPQATATVLLLVGTVYTSLGLGHRLSIVLAFALVQAFVQLALLLKWVQKDFLGLEDWGGEGLTERRESPAQEEEAEGVSRNEWSAQHADRGA